MTNNQTIAYAAIAMEQLAIRVNKSKGPSEYVV